MSERIKLCAICGFSKGHFVCSQAPVISELSKVKGENARLDQENVLLKQENWNVNVELGKLLMFRHPKELLSELEETREKIGNMQKMIGWLDANIEEKDSFLSKQKEEIKELYRLLKIQHASTFPELMCDGCDYVNAKVWADIQDILKDCLSFLTPFLLFAQTMNTIKFRVEDYISKHQPSTPSPEKEEEAFYKIRPDLKTFWHEEKEK